MDLSKLPKMSDTRKAEAQRAAEQSQPASEAPYMNEPHQPGPAAPERARVVTVDAGPSAWISLIIGLLLFLLMPRWWFWLSHRVLGTSFTEPLITDEQGAPLGYEQSVFFLGDMAVALFALALLVEGLVLMWLASHRPAIWLSLLLVAAATAMNVFFVIYMLGKGYQIQIFSMLAAIFGAFMCYQQWQMLHGPRRRYLLIEEP